MTESQLAALEASTDMDPIEAALTVRVPIDTLWALFAMPNLWPRWNRAFYWVRNHSLVRGDHLVWIFQPIRGWYPYKMPAIANLAVVEAERQATWHVTSLPGFFARHTYYMKEVNEATTLFGSWEKASGTSLRVMRGFWLAHFRFVLARSLEGARLLEQIYRREGRLDEGLLPGRAWW